MGTHRMELEIRAKATKRYLGELSRLLMSSITYVLGTLVVSPEEDPEAG